MSSLPPLNADILAIKYQQELYRGTKSEPSIGTLKSKGWTNEHVLLTPALACGPCLLISWQWSVSQQSLSSDPRHTPPEIHSRAPLYWVASLTWDFAASLSRCCSFHNECWLNTQTENSQRFRLYFIQKRSMSSHATSCAHKSFSANSCRTQSVVWKQEEADRNTLHFFQCKA